MFNITFEVTGVLPFPLDMLRHDQAFPVRAEDAVVIADSRVVTRPRSWTLAQYPDAVFRVRLGIVSSTRMAVTHGRWASFGWPVDPDSLKVEKAA